MAYLPSTCKYSLARIIFTLNGYNLVPNLVTCTNSDHQTKQFVLYGCDNISSKLPVCRKVGYKKLTCHFRFNIVNCPVFYRKYSEGSVCIVKRTQTSIKVNLVNCNIPKYVFIHFMLLKSVCFIFLCLTGSKATGISVIQVIL